MPHQFTCPPSIDTVVTPLHVPPLPFCMEVGRTGKFCSKDLQVVHKFSDARGARQSRLGEEGTRRERASVVSHSGEVKGSLRDQHGTAMVLEYHSLRMAEIKS